MLSYALAIAIAVSSLVLFSTAFVMSDIHRQDDFLWSGVGLMYALVLWFCARNITGAVLLGQAAASSLLLSYNWQTLKLRKAIANPEKAAEINNFSLLQAFNGLLKRDRSAQTANNSKSQTLPKVTESEITIPETTTTDLTEQPVTASKIQSQPKKSGFLGKFRRNKSQSGIANTKLNEILDETETTPIKKDTSVATQPQSLVKSAPPAPLQSELDSSKVEEPQEQQLTATPVTTPQETISPVTEQSDSKIAQEGETSATEEQEKSEPNLTQTVTKTDEPLATTTPTVTPETSDTTPEATTHPETVTENTPNTAPVETQENNPEANKNSVATPEQVEVQEITVKSQKSKLDDLETVEVAEILEAMPEDRSHQRDDDNSNIIEVQTTEIEQVNESKKTE